MIVFNWAEIMRTPRRGPWKSIQHEVSPCYLLEFRRNQTTERQQLRLLTVRFPKKRTFSERRRFCTQPLFRRRLRIESTKET